MGRGKGVYTCIRMGGRSGVELAKKKCLRKAENSSRLGECVSVCVCECKERGKEEKGERKDEDGCWKRKKKKTKKERERTKGREEEKETSRYARQCKARC